LQDGGSIPGKGNYGIFSLLHRIEIVPGDHPASCLMGTGRGGGFPRVKRSGCETDHSPPTSAEVKNAWNYTSTSPIRLHCMYIVKHSFTSIITFLLVSSFVDSVFKVKE
jgi:hypothetical protein